MNIAEFSVRRPIFISMMACIVLVLGGISLKYLPVDLFPEIDFPAVSISTTYDDASPEEVEELISKKIEQAVSAVTGIKEIMSNSAEESSNVTVRFNWGTDMEEAVSDIRDRIDRIVKALPDDVERPTLRRFDSAAMPIMRLGVSTDMGLLEAKKELEDQVQYRLERIDGVASASVVGGYTREIQVLIDVDKAKTLDISLDTLLSKLSAANVTTPAGNLKSGEKEIRLRTMGTFTDVEQIGDLLISVLPDGRNVRVRDIAEVIDTHEDITRHIRVNGRPGIYVEVYKQSGSNTVAVAKGIREELDRINEDMGDKFHIVPTMDSSEFISRSINNVADTAISGGILAIIILFFFLCNLRSTMIIAISIPLSVIATFVLVYFCGYTLNVMTLGGLALGIGMLVDNSIVVLENIVRLHDQGQDRKTASINGTSEVVSALIASTLTTVAVFLPLVFTQGLAGVMFRQLAVVIAFSLLCSLVAAISLVPMLSGLLLSESVDASKKQKGFFDKLCAAFLNGFSKLADGYASVLDWVLKHRAVTIFGVLILLAISCLLAPLIGTELMPNSDEGEIRINLEQAVGTD